MRPVTVATAVAGPRLPTRARLGAVDHRSGHA
jgi:hypothetical protein